MNDHFDFWRGATFPQYSLQDPHGHSLLRMLRQIQQNYVLQLQQFICLHPDTCSMGMQHLGHSRITGTWMIISYPGLLKSSQTQSYSTWFLLDSTISFISYSCGRNLLRLQVSLPQCQNCLDRQGFRHWQQKQLNLHLELEHLTLLQSLSILSMGIPHLGHFFVKFSSQLLLNQVIKCLSSSLVRVANFRQNVQSQIRSQPQWGHFISHCFQETTHWRRDIIDCLPIICPQGILATPFYRDISSSIKLWNSICDTYFRGIFL